MEEFAPGTRIPTLDGDALEIIQKLGDGGQGIVYKVRYNGEELALKWYFPNKLHDKTKFYSNIENNIKKGAPTDNFLWPIQITKEYEGSFGYLMRLRPSEYKDFSQFLLAKVHFSGVDAVINAALSIITSFGALHRNGFSYQDLNDGNFFINPQNGDVLICDNDNVAPYGEALGIAGKCRYMAPEIVVGKKKPSIKTDQFSLAVVLYMLLFLNHPLEGKRTMCPCLTEELEYKYYGEAPVFVYDDDNDINRPVKGVHTNELKLWTLYPKFIREIFKRAFARNAMVGNEAESYRVTENEWENTFIQLLNVTIKCPSCGEITFVDRASKNGPVCIDCGRPISRVPILKVGRHEVILAPDKVLHPYHVMKDKKDYRSIVGRVITSKVNPGVFGLKNDTGVAWEAIMKDGSIEIINDGKIVKLSKNMRIKFAYDCIGEIV